MAPNHPQPSPDFPSIGSPHKCKKKKGLLCVKVGTMARTLGPILASNMIKHKVTRNAVCSFQPSLLRDQTICHIWQYRGWSKSCTTLKPLENHCLLVFTGIIIPGFLRWREIGFLHPQYEYDNCLSGPGKKTAHPKLAA